MPRMTERALSRAVWTVGQAFVGGQINDNEWSAIMRTAYQLQQKLSSKYYSVSAKELAAAACAIYFGH